MNRIRTIFFVAIFLGVIIVLMCLGGIIDWENTLYNILLGSTASIIIAFVLEYLNNTKEQKKILRTFFWQGIVKYEQALEELFLYSRDIYNLEELFKDIQKEDGDWTKYYTIYSENKQLFNTLIEGCIREIINNNIKYGNHVADLSGYLSDIDRNGLFFNGNKVYEKCSELYKFVENINWTLCEAGREIQYTSLIKNSDEKICRQLIVCRWIANFYCVDYDRKIVNIDVTDTASGKENKDIIAKKDFEKLINEFIKFINPTNTKSMEL